VMGGSSGRIINGLGVDGPKSKFLDDTKGTVQSESELNRPQYLNDATRIEGTT